MKTKTAVAPSISALNRSPTNAIDTPPGHPAICETTTWPSIVARTRSTAITKTITGTSRPMSRLAHRAPRTNVMTAAISGPMNTTGSAHVERKETSVIAILP